MFRSSQIQGITKTASYATALVRATRVARRFTFVNVDDVACLLAASELTVVNREYKRTFDVMYSSYVPQGGRGKFNVLTRNRDWSRQLWRYRR